MRKIKLFLSLLMLMLVSVGNVWADVSTLTFTAKANGSGTADDGASWTVTSDGTESQFDNTKGIHYGTVSAAVQYIKLTTNDISGTITKVVVNASTASGVSATASVTVGGNAFGGDAQSLSTTATDYTFTGSASGEIVVTVTKPSNATKAIYCKSVAVTYTSDGGGDQPTVSADPESVTNVAFAGVTNQTIDLTYENITGYVTDVTVHPNADGTGTLSPAWLTASVSDADDYATITYSVSANDSAARTAYIKVYTTDGDKEAETIIPVSQVKYSAPTGTFELFSGDIEEGDYVIYYNGKAMNTTITNSRFQYIEVTPSEGEIDNPDESIIWHIAPISETSYWTIYSAAESKYAGGTNSKNQGAMLAEITDLAKWTITGSSTYDFENYGRSQASSDSGNRWLRNNGTNGFATYANTMGGALTLYKKKVAGQPKAPTFSVPGGNYESAQSVELSCETEGATIYYTLDGTTPTNTSSVYSTALAISSTTTIKAIAIKNEISSTVASATYTIIVWQTVADVWDDIVVGGPKNAHVYGYVSQTEVGGYDNNFYISDNGSTEGNQLYAYRMNMNSFSVAVGDKVKLAGDLTNYQGTKEFEYANQGATQGIVVALEDKGALQSVAVSGTPTKTEYASGEDFEPAGLKVFGTYANGFVGEITEGITWGNDLTDGKVTENTTVHVTATVNEVASPAYDVAVTVAAKTLESIALSYDAVEVYQGLELPKPTVTATYSEGDPEDVTSQAVFTGYDASTTGDQEITVTYTFGGHDETANYTVTVNPIFNVELAASVARNLIVNVVGNTESTDDMIVRGKVSYINNASSNAQTYWISDDGTRTNEVEIFKGKYLSGADFTSANQLRVGDEVVVIGKVINYNNSTPEFANGKSVVQSHVRTPNFAITDVTALEVGATDLAVADLTINVEGEGAVTFASSDNTDAVTIVDGKLHAVAAGTATITANLAANGIYKAATAEFNVTVIPATVKYAITFDGNGNTGGSAPEAIADKAAGEEVTLPANSYTKTGYTFTGWKVYDENEDEVTVTANAFEMPASAVVIKAQWAEISVWATTYTSNVTVGTDVVKFSDETEAPTYDAKKTGTGSNYGSTTVTVPYGTTKLHFHAVCYGADTYAVTLKVKNGESVLGTFNINKDAGAKGNSPFILENTPYLQYYSVALTNITEPTDITFEAESGSENGKRFIIFGVNQEGGILPVLDHITITGTMTNTTGWKTGDNIVPEGLTVNAIYTLNNVEQTPVEVDPNDVTWSHAALVENQTEVTLTATYKGKNANKVVTIGAVETGDPTIITDPTTYLNFGSSVEKDAVVASKTITVTLKNITSATATLGGETGDDYSAFSIDDTEIVDGDVITVSVNTGTVGVYAGTVTIKDDNSETQKVITLSMTVVEPETPETAVSTTSKWVAATEADLVDGAEVLITGVKADVTYAMGIQNNNNRAAVVASVDGEGVLTPGENTMSFILEDQGDGTFALRTSNGKYLYAASSSSNYLRSQDAVDGNAKWTISASSAVANGNYTHKMMQFNSDGNGLFSCYTTSTTTQKPIAFYVPKQDTPAQTYNRDNLTPGNYATICLPNSGTIDGAKLFDIEYYDGHNTLYLLEVNGNAMVAGRPYIFLPSAESITVTYTGTEGAEAGSFNGLVGSYSQQNVNEIAGENYILYQNAYYLVNSTAYVGANRAYIHMDGVPTEPSTPQVGQAPRRRVAMSVHGEQVATGMENVQGDNVQCTKVLINGQLFIIRGEKMFDAKGQLVK